jgi:transposase InsO family protein
LEALHAFSLSIPELLIPTPRMIQLRKSSQTLRQILWFIFNNLQATQEFPVQRVVATEVIQRKGPWRHLEAVEFAALRWVDWFNTRRLLEPIGDVPPAEYEARHYEALRRPACTDRRSSLLGDL